MRGATPESVLEDYLAEALEEHRCLGYWADYARRAGGCRVKMALVAVARRSVFPTLILYSSHLLPSPFLTPPLNNPDPSPDHS